MFFSDPSVDCLKIFIAEWQSYHEKPKPWVTVETNYVQFPM